MSRKEHLKKGNKSTQFSSDNQPSPERKSEGWKKKKLLNEIAGSFLSKAARAKAEKLAEFLGFDTKEIDYETFAGLTLLEKAIIDKDVKAYNAVMDRIKGKPVQAITMEEINIKASRYINATTEK